MINNLTEGFKVRYALPMLGDVTKLWISRSESVKLVEPAEPREPVKPLIFFMEKIMK